MKVEIILNSSVRMYIRQVNSPSQVSPSYLDPRTYKQCFCLPLLIVETLLKQHDGLPLRKSHKGYVIQIIFIHKQSLVSRELPIISLPLNILKINLTLAYMGIIGINVEATRLCAGSYGTILDL